MFKNRLKFFFVTVYAIAICSCEPLPYQIFVRNTTSDTAILTLLCRADCKPLNNGVAVRYATGVVPINNKTFDLLNEKIVVAEDSNSNALNIPPKCTIYLGDIVERNNFFNDKYLIVSIHGKSDTTPLRYPFRDLKNIRRKRYRWNDFFYRTILYFDLK